MLRANKSMKLSWYRCVAPDLRGYGDSDKPEKLEEYHISKLRDDVRDLIKGMSSMLANHSSFPII